MERDLISHLAHADHPIAAPITPQHVDALLCRAKLPAGARVLDLGCGEAFWSIRALELYGDAVADGVDISAPALAGARKAAESQGVADRLALHEISATEFAAEPYDLVLCVGSTHAFGGLDATLAAAGAFLKPGGLALVGEGFWETQPLPQALVERGWEQEEYVDLPGTVAQMEAAGFRTVYAHVSEPSEWYDYEWSWTGTLMDWALAHPGEDGDQAMAAALDHRDMWINGYRGVLGFVTALLRRSA